MALLTLAETKALLQITDTSKDTLISVLIPIVESDIREYCNQNFQDSPAVPTWADWMKLPASKMIGYNLSKNTENGLQSESIGTYSYTKAVMIGSYPSDFMKAFDKVKVARIQQAKIRSQFRDLRGMTEAQIVTGAEPRGSQDDILIEAE